MTELRRGRALDRLRDEAAGCRGCDLWRRATQTVFGRGASMASIMLVGEQPGHVEDLMGHPFVGPAGRLLDQALDAAGIARTEVYLANAVKHFSWEPRGKLRIHKKPRGSEVQACRPWIERELAVIQPRALVCLGATAARALLGPRVQVTKARGTVLSSPLAPAVIVTVHPSAILRLTAPSERQTAMARFVEDLRLAARAGAGESDGEAGNPS